MTRTASLSKGGLIPLSLAIIALSWVGSGFAADLTLDAPVTGEIAPGDEQGQSFTLHLEADQPVLVTLQSRDFDTVLSATMPNGERLEVDDSTFTRDSQMILVTEEAGEAEVTARSFNGQGSGRFTLAATALQRLRSLSLGETAEGELAEGDSEGFRGWRQDFWALSLTAGEGVVLELAAESLSCHMDVQIPEGAAVRSDIPGSPGSAWDVLQPSRDCAAVVTVFSWEPGATGGYQLQVTPLSDVLLDSEHPVSGEFGVGGLRRYLPLEEGQLVRIDVEGDGDAAFAGVLTSWVGRIHEWCGVDGRAVLVFPARETGVCAVSAWVSATPEATVPLTLRATGMTPSQTWEVGDTTQVEHTATLSSLEGADVYLLRGDHGRRVGITLSSEDFNPVLVVDGGDMRQRVPSLGVTRSDTERSLHRVIPREGWLMVGVQSDPSGQEGDYTLQVGAAEPQRAPVLELRDPDGNLVPSSAFEGQIRLIDFWSTGCGWCVREFPGFNAIMEEYGDRGVTVIGIALDEDPQVVRDFLEEHEVDFPILMDDGTVQDVFWDLTEEWQEPGGIPTTFIVDRGGVIRSIVLGYHEREFFAAEIDRLLAEEE